VLYEQSNDNVNWSVLLVSPTTSIGGSPTTHHHRRHLLFQFGRRLCARPRFHLWQRHGNRRAGAEDRGAGSVAVAFGEQCLYRQCQQFHWLSRQHHRAGRRFHLHRHQPRHVEPGRYSYFSAFAYADQAGTLYIDWTGDNGSTWQVLSSVAVAAATTQTLRVTILASSPTSTCACAS
jgi:hypothetical protein